MEIRTSCPSGCKYISGDKCIASECPYQTGSVRYDTLNYSTRKSETAIAFDMYKDLTGGERLDKPDGIFYS